MGSLANKQNWGGPQLARTTSARGNPLAAALFGRAHGKLCHLWPHHVGLWSLLTNKASGMVFGMVGLRQWQCGMCSPSLTFHEIIHWWMGQSSVSPITDTSDTSTGPPLDSFSLQDFWVIKNWKCRDGFLTHRKLGAGQNLRPTKTYKIHRFESDIYHIYYYLLTGLPYFDPSKISGRDVPVITEATSQRPRIGAARTHPTGSDLDTQRWKAKDLGLGMRILRKSWGNPGEILGKSWESWGNLWKTLGKIEMVEDHAFNGQGTENSHDCGIATS